MNKQFDGNVTPSRRGFPIKSAGAAMAGTAALGHLNSKSEANTILDSGKVKITVAGYKYDRVDGLAEGQVEIEGCETRFEAAKIGDMNTHIFSGAEDARGDRDWSLTFHPRRGQRRI